jgi:hypothetical protein
VIELSTLCWHDARPVLEMRQKFRNEVSLGN